jgi:uncharacterized protein YgiM (DUF1202 family)
MKFASRGIFSVIIFSILAMFGSGAVIAAPAQQQVQFTAPIMVVNSSFLNIRTGPGVKYEVLITVVGGTQLPVLGVAADRVWYQVSTVIGVGWINSEFVIPRGDFANIPVIDLSNFIAAVPIAAGPVSIGLYNGQGGGGGLPTAPAATNVVGGTFVAGTDANGNPILVAANERFRAALNVPAVELRTAPGDSSTSLGTLYTAPSVDYPIVNRGRDSGGVEWLAIVTPQYGTGWVDAPKLHMRLSAAFRTVMVVTAQTVGMGDGPGTGSTRLPVLSSGTEAFLADISQDGNFIQLELTGGELGWVPFNAAQVRQGTPTDGLQLDPNTIPVAAGVPGAILPQAVPSFGLSVPHVVVNTAFLNIRSGPGANFTSVATASGGDEFPVLGVAKDRVWYLVQGSFGRGWLNNEFAIFRGVYDNVPVINTDVVIGEISQPIAIIATPIPLYAAPGTNFGTIASVGPVEVVVVARSADATWVQVNTAAGFGWVLTSQVTLRGDLSFLPIVG